MQLILFLDLLFLLFLCLLIISYTAILIMLAMPHKLPFVRSSDAKTEAIVRILGDVSGRRIVDLGSGEGKIVIALAEAGAEAHGHEINFILAWWSRFKIRRAGLRNRAFIHRTDFWKEDMGHYDDFTIFGIQSIMPQLEKKMIEEMRSGARIVTQRYEFPHWKPHAAEDSIYLYVKE